MKDSKSITTNLFWKFAERILAQAVSLIVSIVLARILIPEDYGIVAIVMIFITFLDVMVTNGLPTALIQKKDVDQLDYSSVFFVNISLSVILYILLFFLAGPIESFYKMEHLGEIIRVMGLRIIIASVNSVQHAYVSQQMMFRKYFWSTLFGTLFSGVAGIILAVKGFGAWALVAQYMINSTVDTIVLWFTVQWRPDFMFSWQRVRALFSFGWNVLVEGLAETFSQQIRSLLIGKVYTSADLAYYNKSQQIPNLLISNIGTSISSVLFPAMSQKQGEETGIIDLMRRAVRVSTYILFPMMTGLALVAEPLIIVLLKEKWLPSAPYLQIFCLTQALTLGMMIRHQALLSTGRSNVFMMEHMIYRICFLIVLFLVYKKSVMAIALTNIFGSILMAGIVMFTSKKYNGYAYRDQIADVLPTIISCAAMAVPLLLIRMLSLPPFASLILQIIVGAGVYWLISSIIKPEGYDYVKSLLTRFFGSRFKRKGLGK